MVSHDSGAMRVHSKNHRISILQLKSYRTFNIAMYALILNLNPYRAGDRYVIRARLCHITLVR